MPSKRKDDDAGGLPEALRRAWRFLAAPAKVPACLLLLAALAAAFAVYQGVEMDRTRERLEREVQARRKMTGNLERMIRFQDVLLRGFEEHAAQNGYAPERLRDSLAGAGRAPGQEGGRQARGESSLGAPRGRAVGPSAEVGDGSARSAPRRSGGGSAPRRERP